MEDASMTITTVNRLIMVLALSLISGAALGQAPQAATWQGAQALVVAKKNVKIITIAHPKLRHPCAVVSISANEIICGHSGHTMTFRAEDVAAVIEPGEHSHWYLYFAGSLAAAGAATWGTVVLAAVCPICAAATGVAALFLYVITPGTAFLSDDDSADSLLYLAPGQTLKVGLG
jgi:hypothetical protein